MTMINNIPTAGASSSVSSPPHPSSSSAPSTQASSPPFYPLHSVMLSIYGTLHFLLKLFFSKRFIVHRVMGLLYLIQFVAALYLYFADYQYFYNSILIWSLPLSGFSQSIIASLTFTFLPKKQDDPGYYGDKSVLSYNFITENIFFSGLLLYQWLYMHDTYRSYIQNACCRFSFPVQVEVGADDGGGGLMAVGVPFVIESACTFLPYLLFRPFFPKTSFRSSLNKDKNKTEQNRSFFTIVTWVTKLFYIWAKHYMGFFLNYARFLDRISPAQIEHIYLMLIFGAAATTISMFLHTLKFKHYIGPRTAYLWYMASYLATFYSWVRIFGIFVEAWDIAILTFLGVLLQFGPQLPQHCHQLALTVLFNLYRHGALPQSIGSIVFAADMTQ